MNLEHIFLEAVINDRVRKDSAWDVLSDFSRFPSLSKNIDKILLRGKTGIEQVSEWDVTFDGAPLNWMQKDIFVKDTYSINFKTIAGDFEQYAGSFHIENSTEGNITLVFSAGYNVGIPIIEELFGPVFKEKMQSNFKALLNGIAEEISRNKILQEERVDRRYKIGVSEAMIFDGNIIEAKIEDISRCGMRFSCEETLVKPLSLQSCGLDLEAKFLHHEFWDKKYRLVFEKPIESDRLMAIVKMLQSRHVTTLGKYLTMEPTTSVYS
jgi:ribosome-associated toxin RatA of RatAB toxin-antitoxin module